MKSSAPTDVVVSAELGSVMAIMIAVICLMNKTAVSDIRCHSVSFCIFNRQHKKCVQNDRTE